MCALKWVLRIKKERLAALFRSFKLVNHQNFMLKPTEAR